MSMRNQITNWPTFSAIRDTWTPFSELLLDDWMPTSMPSGDGLRNQQQFVPACEVEEAQDHYVLSLEIPGVRKDDIKVEFHDDQIVISGERNHSENRKNQGLRYTELNTGRFQRSFALPSHVDAEKVEANYQDGVLRVFLPKAESAKPRQIKITNGSGASKFFGKFLGAKDKAEVRSEIRESEPSSSESRNEKVAS